MQTKSSLTEKFYNRLNYSFGNEDHKTELKALEIHPEDTIVCVTASGDRPLNLLTQECKKIYSIDCNPIQNHLLSLKMKAMQTLEIEEYLNFLGATFESYPSAFTDSIIQSLPADAKDFWKNKSDLLESGVIYQGHMEKFCFWIAILLNIFLKKEIYELFSCTDIFEQQKLIDRIFQKKSIRFLSKVLLHPKLNKKYFSDPGLYAYVDSKMKVHEHLLQLIKRSLEVHLVRENPLLNLVFQGKVGPEAFPPYLQREGIHKIKPRLDKISIVHDNMINFLESLPSESIDCFSFSDIASYMSCSEFNRLLKAMIHCAKPGARFCIRELMSRHTIDQEISSKLQRNEELEQELKAQDNCFVYQFIIGKI